MPGPPGRRGLPAADRTEHGYRTYTPLHARALDAFLAMVPGHGHRTAAAVMRAVNRGATDEALRDLAPTTADGPDLPYSRPRGTFIGPLAESLGVQPATLRKWEHAGLVHPRRDPLTGYRVYDDAAVRDARLTHQLRRGGYLLEQIAPLIAQVRAAGGLEPLEAMLSDWRGRLSTRGRAMLTGAALLDTYLRERG
ncbi:TioE family transcriptional regulator [Streptomyces sp. DSM 118878]